MDCSYLCARFHLYFARLFDAIYPCWTSLASMTIPLYFAVGCFVFFLNSFLCSANPWTMVENASTSATRFHEALDMRGRVPFFVRVSGTSCLHIVTRSSTLMRSGACVCRTGLGSSVKSKIRSSVEKKKKRHKRKWRMASVRA